MKRINFKQLNHQQPPIPYVKVKKEIEPKEVKTEYKWCNIEALDYYQRKYDDEELVEIKKPLIKYDLEDLDYPNNHLKITLKDENIPKTKIVEKVIKEDSSKVIKELNPKGYHRQGFSHWHQYASYKLNGAKLIITDNFGGCSVQQLYEWGNSCDNENNDELIDYVLKDLSHSTGLLLCQVGCRYYGSNFVKALEKYGFTSIVEYKNHQHGGVDTGRLYSLVIEKKSERNN